MPVTDLLERNHKLYGDEIALVELNPMIKDARKKPGRNIILFSRHLLHHTDVKSHGVYLMKKQTE